MQIEIRSVLYDIQKAISRIEEFTANADFAGYQNNAMMRSAVERQLEIIGEAVRRLSEMNASLADRITERPRIISFRNQLIHGYFVIDDRVVWDVIQTKLPVLKREIKALSQEAGETE